MGTLTVPATSVERFMGLIGDALIDSAIVVGAQATWLAPTVEWCNGNFEAVDRTGDANLYDGSAGIALACAAVGLATHRFDLVDVAVQGARHAVAGTARTPAVGLYDGRAGIGLAALAVGRWADDVELTRSGTAILDTLGNDEPEANDLVSGLAGVALAFARAATLTGRERWLDSARATVETLVQRAERLPWGWTWREEGDHPGLCGLAHGAAGPAWVFAEVAAACGEPEAFDDAIAGARQYERSWFDPRTNRWPDLRAGLTTGEPPPRPTHWCHGSVGIGLSRLGVNACRPHPAVQAEAAAALQSSCIAAVEELERGVLDRGLTICHGLAGTVDLLVDAHHAFAEGVHLEAARRLVDQALGLLGDDVASWPGGVQGRPGPGLMNGLAGTMAVLTRVARPETLPSIGRLGV